MDYDVINGWMKHSFLLPHSLYITTFDEIKSIILLSLCVLFIMFIIMKNIPNLLKKFRSRKTEKNIDNESLLNSRQESTLSDVITMNLFLDNIEIFKNLFE